MNAIISTLSNLIAELSLCTKWHVTWHLHVMSARCVARDLHTVAPGPLERTCWRQFAALWGDCKKISNSAFGCDLSLSSSDGYSDLSALSRGGRLPPDHQDGRNERNVCLFVVRCTTNDQCAPIARFYVDRSHGCLISSEDGNYAECSKQIIFPNDNTYQNN